MASKNDLDFTYTTIDEIFRLSLGETADYSGAKFDSDFSLTIKEAQKAKHRFIAESLNISSGSKVLDMACGWGPFLTYLKGIGAKAMGVTLSSGQAKACIKNGLDVSVKDCLQIRPEDYGIFDAVTCIGGLEHFCSIEEYQKGNQTKIYESFFHNVSQLLKPNGRFYMQTMVFTPNMLPLEAISIDDDKNSDSYALALMVKQFPGSWLPYGSEHVVSAASGQFKLISISSGRLDYIETINRWRKAFRKFQLKKYFLYASLIPKFLFDKEFRHQVAVFKVSPNKVCFERQTMEHYRFVFEKL